MKFGLVPRQSRYLSDRTGHLSRPQIKSLRRALRRFEKKFPQVLFSVLIIELPAGQTVNEYAFWIANRARFSSVEKTAGDNLDLLLVIDAASDTAALNAGYGLEPYVTEEDLQRTLDALAPHLRGGDWVGGILACLASMSEMLRDCCARAQQKEREAEEELP